MTCDPMTQTTQINEPTHALLETCSSKFLISQRIAVYTRHVFYSEIWHLPLPAFEAMAALLRIRNTLQGLDSSRSTHPNHMSCVETSTARVTSIPRSPNARLLPLSAVRFETAASLQSATPKVSLILAQR